MTRGTLKICTILLVLFLAAPPAFCIQCCCTSDAPAMATGDTPHGCCAKPKTADSIPLLTAKAACDCPDLYEPMVAVATAATTDCGDGSRFELVALSVDRVSAARPRTIGHTLQLAPPPEIERHPGASPPSRAPPAAAV